MATVESSDMQVVVEFGEPLRGVSSYYQGAVVTGKTTYGMEPEGVVKSVGGGGILMKVGVAIVMTSKQRGLGGVSRVGEG